MKRYNVIGLGMIIIVITGIGIFSIIKPQHPNEDNTAQETPISNTSNTLSSTTTKPTQQHTDAEQNSTGQKNNSGTLSSQESTPLLNMTTETSPENQDNPFQSANIDITKIEPNINNTEQAGPPPGLEDFLNWELSKQMQFVNERMNTPNLDPALLEFFRASLHNPALSPHVRNNMANALMAQERKNPDLYKDFIALANDENQEERFRAYAIQFLAETRSFSNNSKEVIDQTLTSLAYSKAEKATPLLAAQAQMMMTSLEMQGDMKLPENFNDLQVSVLQDSNADQAAQITALSILGRRNADEHRDIIRQYAETENPAQRTAIAALGQLQNPKDKPIIEAALNSNDYLVKLAAEAALKKFE